MSVKKVSLVALTLLTLTGCASTGGAPMALEAPMESESSPAAITLEEARSEIKNLEVQIGAGQGYREEFGVESAAPREEVAPTDEEGAVSAEEAPDCGLVCDVAAAVCRSSQRVCTISGQFPEEGHFRERCAWASQECAKAKERCESCR